MAKARVVGLDIGTTHVSAAEVEVGGAPGRSPVVLQRFAHVPIPLGAVRDGEVVDTETVATALRELWSQGRFSTKDVVIGVGNQRVVVRELELPWMPLPQLRASLPYQVQELLPMPIDEALLDYYPTGEHDGQGGRMVQGMLVAAARDTVNANIVAVEAAGLRPAMVDLNAFALMRSVVAGELAQRTVAVVEVGARITNVVIAAQGVPRFIRTLPNGGQDVTDAVASALGIAAAEAEAVKRELGIGYAVPAHMQSAAEAVNTVSRTLIESVRNTFVYYQSNHPGAGIEGVVLVGGGSHLPGFGQYLASASRLAVSLGDPLSTIRLGKSVPRERLVGMETLVAMPVGLSLGVAA